MAEVEKLFQWLAAASELLATAKNWEEIWTEPHLREHLYRKWEKHHSVDQLFLELDPDNRKIIYIRTSKIAHLPMEWPDEFTNKVYLLLTAIHTFMNGRDLNRMVEDTGEAWQILRTQGILAMWLHLQLPAKKRFAVWVAPYLIPKNVY